MLETAKKDLEAFENPVEELKPIIDKTSTAVASSLRRTPGAAVELLLSRDELVEAVDGLEIGEEDPQMATVLADLKPKLPEIVKGRALPASASSTPARKQPLMMIGRAF